MKALKMILKIVGRILLILLIAFVSTFTIFMANLDNRLIYFIVRPLLNSHYAHQTRDRRI